MPTYEVIGVAGTRVVKASNEAEARHLAMVERWGDVSDKIVSRTNYRDPDGPLNPYRGDGLTVRKIRN